MEAALATPRMEQTLSRFHRRVVQWLIRSHNMRRGVGVGIILHWQRQWRKRALRISGPMSQGGRIQSHSILRRDRLWTSVIGLLGRQGCGCFGGGGSRTDWTRRGQMKEQRQSQIDRRHNARRRYWKSKKRRTANEGGQY